MSPIDERVRGAVARVTAWMADHGAEVIVQNLAEGADDEAIARVEAAIGAPVPAALAALWRLHDGQLEEMNGFVEHYDLCSTDGALGAREDALAAIGFARESPSWWARSGGTDAELASDAWLPFAARDSDTLAVEARSGRVFRVDHDDSPAFLALSFEAWLEAYAARVEGDDYAVEEGFGEAYLALRDRAAERRAAEVAERRDAHERMRRSVPLGEQMAAAVAKGDPERAAEVIEDARAAGDEALAAAVARLFEGAADPRFVAAALRTSLRAVRLDAPAWARVAIGGALLGNNAIRDVALGRAKGLSMEALGAIARRLDGAPARDRAGIEAVIEALRASAPPDATKDERGFFARLFGGKKPGA